MQLRGRWLAAAAVAGPTFAQQFIVPPDLAESSVPDTSLSYAFGETMTAQWWTDWQTITLKLETCYQNTTFTLFESQPNLNHYTFPLTKNLTGPCSGYSLSVTAVTDADGYAAKGLVINSQHFKILNITDPSSIVGSFTEPVTTGTGSALTTHTLTTTIFVTGTAVPTSGVGNPATSTLSAVGAAATNPSSQGQKASSGSPPDLKYGLGIGLGLGIPIVIAAIVGLICLRRRRIRRPRSLATHDHSEGVKRAQTVSSGADARDLSTQPKELAGMQRVEAPVSNDKPLRTAAAEADSQLRSASELAGSQSPRRHELPASSIEQPM